MIQKESNLRITDNCGIKLGKYVMERKFKLRIYKCKKKNYAKTLKVRFFLIEFFLLVFFFFRYIRFKVL